jgi:SAM-dependent methyltransferase
MVDDELLLAALEESHRFGALGEAAVVALSHGERFLAALGAARFVLDLGSGGGVPGLIIAARCPDLRVTLLDRRTARTDLLLRLVGRLGLADRVEVVAGDAEKVGRDPRYNGQFDTVVCRSFGAPLTTARCARPFLAPQGRLVVSEPPDNEPRWDHPSIGALGFTAVASPPTLQVLTVSDDEFGSKSAG